MSSTVQERVFEEVVHHFRSIRQGEPESDPYHIQWDFVFARSPTEHERKAGNVLSIVWLNETSQRLHGFTVNKRMTVAVEWWRTVTARDSEGGILGDELQTFGELLRRVYELSPQSPLYNEESNILDVVEQGTEPTSDEDAARNGRISGTVLFEVMYRHSAVDPRQGAC